jgi:hypothetical protein
MAVRISSLGNIFGLTMLLSTQVRTLDDEHSGTGPGRP